MGIVLTRQDKAFRKSNFKAVRTPGTHSLFRPKSYDAFHQRTARSQAPALLPSGRHGSPALRSRHQLAGGFVPLLAFGLRKYEVARLA